MDKNNEKTFSCPQKVFPAPSLPFVNVALAPSLPFVDVALTLNHIGSQIKPLQQWKGVGREIWKFCVIFLEIICS